MALLLQPCIYTRLSVDPNGLWTLMRVRDRRKGVDIHYDWSNRVEMMGLVIGDWVEVVWPPKGKEVHLLQVVNITDSCLLLSE